MFVEELDDVEAALVDVEVDVAHLESRAARRSPTKDPRGLPWKCSKDS